MTCERCYQPLSDGEHGLYKCPLQPRQSQHFVWQDSIEGGIEIAHGLCNADGSPRRYYSKSEIKQACAVKGFVPYHEVYAEAGNQRIKDAQVRQDWYRSSEAQRARAGRVELRHEKAKREEAARARR